MEDESDGPSRLRLIVSPSVGELDEAAVVEAVVERLGRRGIGERLTAQTWRGSGTITLERRNPTVNGSLKVQPLRTVSP